MTTSQQPSEIPRIERPPTVGRVVVGVDGSPRSEEALRYGAAVARWQNWTLHLVHTWHVNYPIGPLAMDFGDIAQEAQDAAMRTMRDVEKDVLGDDLSLDVRRSLDEGPAARILIEASEGADLLIVGSRGRGGFSSLALGSVGQACVHHAHCPVLIVRPKTSEWLE